MKLKNENGFTLTSIAISVIIIFIFVSLIALLVYNYNSTMRSTQLKSTATVLAVDEIEKIKNDGYIEETYNDIGINEEEVFGEENTAIENNDGFFKTIKIIDYKYLSDNQSNDLIENNVVKKITVEISYQFKNKIEKVQLSTIISNPNKGEE